MSNIDSKLEIMKNEKIFKALLKLGIPTMIGMLVSALYSIVDAYFVGGLGTSQIGAVAVVFPIVQIIIGLGMTFGSGAASYISRLLGKKDYKKANQTAMTALVTSFFVGLVSIVVALCFLDKILILLGATNTILPYAREYALIYVSGSILSILNVTMNNIVVAEGKAKLAMLSMLIGGGLNIILNPIFIYTLNLKIQGAAIATVCAQLATSLLYLWFILGKKSSLKFSFAFFTFDKKIYIEILKIGVPILVFQILASTSISLTNTAASVYGDSAVAAFGIVTRVMTLGTYIVFGYMKGFQPIVGFNYGAKKYNRMNKATKLSLVWSTTFCTVVAIIMLIFPKQIISVFSGNDMEFINIGAQAIKANGIIFPLYGFQMVYMALFLAIGYGKEGGLLSISRQGLFFIPIVLIIPKIFGIEGIIWAQPLADLLTVILTLLLSISLNKKLKALSVVKVV